MNSTYEYLLENMLDRWRLGEVEDYAMADFLIDCGREEFAEHVRKGAPILEEIGGEYSDWKEAFGYVGEPDSYAFSNREYSVLALEIAAPNDVISTRLFSRKEVKKIIAIEEGENDGANWRIVGELWDGRFFWLSAGCDYTGWD